MYTHQHAQGTLQAGRALVELLEAQVAQPLVVQQLPVLPVGLLGLVVNIDRDVVPAQQVQRPADLLQVLGVLGVQPHGVLQSLEGLADLALLPEDHGFDEHREVGLAAVPVGRALLDQVQALFKVLHWR